MMTSRRLLSVSAIMWAMSLTLIGAPRPAQAEPTDEAAKPLSACDRFMGAYTRSAARKMARSLAGQKYEFTQLPEQSSLKVSIPDAKDLRFDLLFEHDRAAAGVVEKTRTHRTTYVVSHFQIGPVVALHQWPSRKAIASGKAECKPVSTSIGFPSVPVAEIDVDPFKFWGLRVIWHIPNDLPDEAVKTAPLDALRAVIRSTS